jgi:ribonuclease P protein component
MPEYRFKKKHRLAKKKEISLVFSENRIIKNRDFVIYYRKNRLDNSRLCVITTKKTGIACRRNRFKRLVKEFFRLNQYNFTDNYDFIIIVRKFNCLNDFKNAEASLNRLLIQNEIIKNDK